jgi:beta-barrel assembly-enhancing protease
MKKHMKEVGLAMLTTMAGGGSSGEIARETARLLSSTAFDREQESEADHSAVHMMAKAGIDPEHLANFFFRLSHEKSNVPREFEWLSTHPNSEDRSSDVLALRKLETFQTRTVIDSTRWQAVKQIVSAAGDR